MSAQLHTLGQGQLQTCRSGPKVADFHAKTSSEVCDPYRLDILVLCTPLCVLKTTDEVGDPYRHVILVLKSLF